MPNLSGTKFGPVFDGHSSACAWELGVCLQLQTPLWGGIRPNTDGYRR